MKKEWKCRCDNLTKKDGLKTLETWWDKKRVRRGDDGPVLYGLSSSPGSGQEVAVECRQRSTRTKEQGESRRLRRNQPCRGSELDLEGSRKVGGGF